MKLRVLLVLLLLLPGRVLLAAAPAGTVEPLSIGDSFTIESNVLGEVRRINVYRAPGNGAGSDAALPVLYMPDGGLAEDFLHVAGLVQVSVMNGTMRPFMLVGIENTERRRDLTGPTDNPEDRRIAPRVGGSAAFRVFIADELMPAIDARYATTGETAIVGESLAGLFVLETLIRQPELFDAYVAIDPSLWWNNHALLAQVGTLLEATPGLRSTVFIASSDEPGMAEPVTRFVDALRADPLPGVRVHHAPMPDEHHRTIYHPAALRAFRELFGDTSSEDRS
jgi:uncharacterized protein